VREKAKVTTIRKNVHGKLQAVRHSLLNLSLLVPLQIAVFKWPLKAPSGNLLDSRYTALI
jgi:hypothetical protein